MLLRGLCGRVVELLDGCLKESPDERAFQVIVVANRDVSD